MDKQDQDSFDLFDDFIKTDPEISASQTMQNKYCLRKPKTFKNEDGGMLSDATFNDFDYQTTEQFAPVEIKEEIIECEMPKIEGHLDLQTKFDQDTVSDHFNIFPKTIKQELQKPSDVKVTVIKQEGSEYTQPKTESVMCELLTSECDLPTLKIESTDYFPDNYLGYTYSMKTLKNNGRKYACPICQNNFPSSKSRSTHIDVHFKKRYAICQFCGRLMKKIEFFKHVFIHKVKNRIKNHIAGTFLKCNIYSKKLKRKNIDDVDDKSFKCGTCSKNFNEKYKLQKHLIIHSGEKQFKCDVCSKCFNDKSNLRKHLIIHSGEKTSKCDICSKRFNRKYDLQRHLIIHSGEKLFECDICFKRFNLNFVLQRHLLIHSGEKPFECDICSKCFTLKSNLRKHLLIHSSEKPFKSFKCDICSKCFALKSHLQRHLKIHSGEKPLKCDICSKGFAQKPHLRQHQIIHMGEKPFKCDICSKCFNNKSNLQKHLLIHSGERPFKCDVCSKAFNRNHVLQRHLLIHN